MKFILFLLVIGGLTAQSQVDSDRDQSQEDYDIMDKILAKEEWEKKEALLSLEKDEYIEEIIGDQISSLISISEYKQLKGWETCILLPSELDQKFNRFLEESEWKLTQSAIFRDDEPQYVNTHIIRYHLNEILRLKNFYDCKISNYLR